MNREPENPYDQNAIQVRNVMGDQIGHLPRTIASKLAPYMVRELVIVPTPASDIDFSLGFEGSACRG